MNISQKPIRKASPLHKYVFPVSLADDFDKKANKRVMTISIGRYKRLIPVGEPVEISRDEWVLLNSIGGHLPENSEYDPVRKS